MLDEKTLTFLLQLKSCNEFWYITLLKCAAESPKLGSKCIEQICTLLTDSSLDATGVNVWQICMLVNKKHPLLESIKEGIGSSAWEYYRESRIQKAKIATRKLEGFIP